MLRFEYAWGTLSFFLFLQMGFSHTDKAKESIEIEKRALNLASEFEKIVTQEQLSNARECMRSSAFVTVMNGNEYLRVTESMSNGYFYGTLISFAKNYCASLSTEKKSSFLKTLVSTVTKDSDSLSHLPLKADPLQHNYAILYALGMIESDGKFDEGRDASAWNIDAQSAEAGTYQASYDSHLYTHPKTGAQKITYVPQDVYDALMKKYEDGNSTLCLKDIFSIKQATSSNIETWGWGKGVKFQDAMKKCPALAADYQAYLLRKTYAHNGPVKRRHAQPRMECVRLMDAVADLLEKDDRCQSLNHFSENFTSYSSLANYDFKMNDLSPRLLERGPEAWVKGAANKGWSYEPLVLSHYWLSEKKLDSKGNLISRPDEELKKPYPRYSEIPWLKNVIKYWESVAKNNPDEKNKAEEMLRDYRLRIQNILTEKKDGASLHLNAALEKYQNDLEYADVALALLRKDLSDLDLNKYDLDNPQAYATLSEVKRAKLLAYLKFKRQRLKFMDTKNKILNDFGAL